MDRDFIDHLARIRATGEVENARSVTQLGWCNALVLALQRVGVAAELVECKAKSYREHAPPDPLAYAEEFTFHCITPLVQGKLDEPLFFDGLGNWSLGDIARQEASARYWEYEESSIIHHKRVPPTAPETMSDESNQMIREMIDSICKAWSDFQASHIESATPAAGSVRPRRF